MIKILMIIVSTAFIVEGCSMKPIKRREKYLNQAITALERYDTMRLFSLLDTNYCFDVYSKDAIMDKIEFVYNRFKHCVVSLPDSLIFIRETQPNIMEYSLHYCRGKKSEIINESFDLVFTFSNYDKRVLVMDVKKYRKEIEATQLPSN